MKLTLPIVALLAWYAMVVQAQSSKEFGCQQHKSHFLSNQTHRVQSFNNVSDTLDALKYTISLNFDSSTVSTVAAKTLRGNTEAWIKPKMNGINKLSLKLLKLVVDSIKVNNTLTTYSYNDTLLRINTPTLTTNDTAKVRVYYHGKPQQDPTFGGFYFQSPYIYNIGVGFDANPHNFGRVWFPCIDEFTDRAVYDFYITTIGIHKAFCNGLLQNVTTNANTTKTWFWRMNQTIPTYLAAVAVADYTTLYRNSQGVPVQFGCRPSDTNAVKSMFTKLDTAVKYDIQRWGAHPFDKIGFVFVPFNGGAMEHASSIHMPSAAISSGYEFLYAHELSHHWFGDLVTCETAEDMWLNEGWAAYNEAMFMEKAYDTIKYKDYVRTNHREVLQLTHTPLKDGGYYALYGIPHNITYGSTVYDKGADIVHTLRYYMGDAAFFPAVNQHLANRAFQNANSYQLRDNLALSSGMNMTDFFNNWVFAPGNPHFSIDSTKAISIGGGMYNVNVYVRQRLKGASTLYNMKVPISACSGANTHHTQTFSINQATQMITLTNVPFLPTWFAVDRWEKVSDATSDFESNVTTAGTLVFKETNVTLNTLNIADGSARLRITHEWVAPDGAIAQPGIVLSDYHYWTVAGHFPTNFVTQGSFRYDGSLTSTGYIDNTFINVTEDSLVILYRPKVGMAWSVVNASLNLTGTLKMDKKGTYRVDTLKSGEYALGKKVGTTSIQPKKSLSKPTIYPNPSQEQWNIKLPEGIDYRNVKITLSDIQGKEWVQQTYHQPTLTLSAKTLPSGVYICRIQANQQVWVEKLVKE